MRNGSGSLYGSISLVRASPRETVLSDRQPRECHFHISTSTSQQCRTVLHLPGCRVLQSPKRRNVSGSFDWSGSSQLSLQALAVLRSLGAAFCLRPHTTSLLTVIRSFHHHLHHHRRRRADSSTRGHHVRLDQIRLLGRSRHDSAASLVRGLRRGFTYHPTSASPAAWCNAYPTCLRLHLACAFCQVSEAHSTPSSPQPNALLHFSRLIELSYPFCEQKVLHRLTTLVLLCNHCRMARLTQSVLVVGGNAVSAFLSWRLSATNACDVTLVWKSGYESVHQYGISFRYGTFISREGLSLTRPQIKQIRQRALQTKTWYGVTLA
jgi:hypothetical protein